MERSRVPIEQLVHRYGMARACAGARRRYSGAVAARTRPRALATSCEREIARALDEDRAEAIVLGCAGMADLAAELQREFGVPVIDGVAAAVKQAEALVALGLSTGKRGAYARPLAKPYHGALQSSRRRRS